MAFSIHTSHRTILLLPAAIYVVLVIAIAVVPAQMAKSQEVAQAPRIQEETRGRELYVSYGCIYCHTQQIRGDERLQVATQEGVVVPVLPADRRFGLDEASTSEDYDGENPPLLGTQRTGPDLTVVGTRMNSVEWHYLHLYAPRRVSPDSQMSGLHWLFRTEADLPKDKTPEEMGWEAVAAPTAWGLPNDVLYATKDARALVDYLLSLTRERYQR